jgi:hypothetical protein
VKSVEEFDQSEKNDFENYMFSTSSIGCRNIKFLTNLVESARNDEIQVVGVVAPLPPSSLSHIVNYEEITSFYKDLSNDLGIVVVDYNQINHSENTFKDSDFKDDDHLNYKGVQKLCNDILERVLIKYAF